MRYLFALLVLTLALSGCGGGGSSQQATRTAGTATFTVDWGKPSRLIPVASKSVKLVVKLAGKTLSTKVVPRPTAGGTTKVTITGLPIDTVTNTVTACPNADGSGVPQAAGSAPLLIKDDNSAALTITMQSTIDHLELNPGTAQTIGLFAILYVTAAPKDKDGQLVLTDPFLGNFSWTSSKPDVATVSDGSDGVVKVSALKEGTTILTVTESESKKTATLSVTVGVDSGMYTISGASNSPFYVRDNLTLWHNSDVIFQDTPGTADGNRGPFSFTAKKTDTIRIQVRTPGTFGGSGEIFLTVPDGHSYRIRPRVIDYINSGNGIVIDNVWDLKNY